MLRIKCWGGFVCLFCLSIPGIFLCGNGTFESISSRRKHSQEKYSGCIFSLLVKLSEVISCWLRMQDYVLLLWIFSAKGLELGFFFFPLFSPSCLPQSKNRAAAVLKLQEMAVLGPVNELDISKVTFGKEMI